MQVKANGIAFNCQIDGARGAPWLIFSNSLATNLSMWEHQARALSTRFQVLRYDQRGHGKTEAPEGPYAFATLLADVIALMDALEVPARVSADCLLAVRRRLDLPNNTPIVSIARLSAMLLVCPRRLARNSGKSKSRSPKPAAWTRIWLNLRCSGGFLPTSMPEIQRPSPKYARW